jgi:hypothetical protein
MGKRFVPVRDADKRAIALHLMLQEVEQMPLIEVQLSRDEKQPIIIIDRQRRGYWWIFTVDGFLALDLEQAKANGGTALALIQSRKKKERSRLPQTEIDRAVDQFLTGDEDE